MPPDSEAKKAWDKKHTTLIAIKLNHNKDKDLLEALEGEASKAGAVKKLMRIGLEAEKRSRKT